MSTFKHAFRRVALLALAVSILLPVHAEAATWQDYVRSYSRNRSDESTEVRQTSSRERYSSSIQRAVNKLDDDKVEDLPIPVMLGVSVPQLSKNFGDPRDGGARTHEGLDILAPRGAFVASPTEAVVVKVGTGSSAGKYVTTANPGKETFTYMHLDDFADGIKAGVKLAPGDLIGYVGDTGNAKGGVTHLHFEIRKNRKAMDPYPRLTREFTTQQRIDLLTEVLKDLQAELKRK
ncbi:MAG: peptidase, M23/M37 family [Parcubacteria bacterium C7867-004]|nr:MAG: peptidase, M23/M37 family [Parcubacteria bacterium C7867-004]